MASITTFTQLQHDLLAAQTASAAAGSVCGKHAQSAKAHNRFLATLFFEGAATPLNAIYNDIRPWIYVDGQDVRGALALAHYKADQEGADAEALADLFPEALVARISALLSIFQTRFEDVQTRFGTLTEAVNLGNSVTAKIDETWKMKDIHSVHSVHGFFDDIGNLFSDAGRAFDNILHGHALDKIRQDKIKEELAGFDEVLHALSAAGAAAGTICDALAKLRAALMDLPAFVSAQGGDTASVLKDLLGEIPTRTVVVPNAELMSTTALSVDQVLAAVNDGSQASTIEGQSQSIVERVGAWARAQNEDYVAAVPVGGGDFAQSVSKVLLVTRPSGAKDVSIDWRSFNSGMGIGLELQDNMTYNSAAAGAVLDYARKSGSAADTTAVLVSTYKGTAFWGNAEKAATPIETSMATSHSVPDGALLAQFDPPISGSALNDGHNWSCAAHRWAVATQGATGGLARFDMTPTMG